MGADALLRPVELADVASLVELVIANRDHLAPWDPVRGQEYFTEAGQRDGVERQLRNLSDGAGVPLVIVAGERVIGRVTLSNIARGPFLSANLGYWIHAHAEGQGIMTRAVGATVEMARTELQLHRLEAGTLVRNEGSQRVLLKNDFEVIGTARRYLKIAGVWQDHLLFQRILED